MCFGCGNVGHVTRDCPTRSAQSVAQANVSCSLNAVASSRGGATQLFLEAVIDGVRITDALIDTVSAVSMLSTALYSRLASAPVIQPFTGTAPDVVSVGGGSAAIRGNIDAPVELDGCAVHHTLLVIEGLAFALLISMDVHRPHGATLSFVSDPVRLRRRICDDCPETRTELLVKSHSASLCDPSRRRACSTHSRSRSRQVSGCNSQALSCRCRHSWPLPLRSAVPRR